MGQKYTICRIWHVGSWNKLIRSIVDPWLFNLFLFVYISAKSCPDPGIPKNGYKHGLSFVGDVVTFTCEHCYRLVGDSNRTCLKNTTWSHTQPKCVCESCLHCRFCKSRSYAKVRRRSFHVPNLMVMSSFRCMPLMSKFEIFNEKAAIWIYNIEICCQPTTGEVQWNKSTQSNWEIWNDELALTQPIKRPTSYKIQCDWFTNT